MKRVLSKLAVVALPLVSFAGIYLPPTGEEYKIGSNGKIESYGPGYSSSKSSAVYMDDSRIVGWASGYMNYNVGTKGFPVFDTWKTPNAALGKADGDSEGIVCLGDGGSITMTFERPIGNGEGYDFVVFENAFGEEFLELAFVEVSTDGVNFVRFPNFYLGEMMMGPFDNYSDPEQIYNLGSKYLQGYGGGYDLQELFYAYEYALDDSCLVSNGGSFTDEYRQHLLENFPLLDLDSIGYVRIVDIVGDGSEFDSSGHPIFDPIDCLESPGFDLDAIGVINWGNNIPEPAEYAAIFSAFALVVAFLRKRKN